MGADGRRGNGSLENYGWGKNSGLESWLFAEGYRFDFFQAVRLLEMIQAASNAHHLSTQNQQVQREISNQSVSMIGPGEGADPRKEIVRFKSAVGLDFPASDVAEVRSGKSIKEPAQMVSHFKSKKAPAEMTVNFLGLAGGLGALDIPTTELVIQRASRNDEALKDFLDIFNHRLVSLLYRIRKHHRVGLGVATPGEDGFSRYLYSLIGLGTPNLQGRMRLRDRALLNYAGILAQQPRSIVGLERILADYFQVNVKSFQFKGEWRDLEEDQWTKIGVTGRNQRLGYDTVVLGTRVWDQQARFEIHLGPLRLREFLGFLPTSWRFAVLCDLIRFYIKDRFKFSIRLILKSAEIPAVRLGASHPVLSWSSWLGSLKEPSIQTPGSNGGGPVNGHNPYITISPDSLRSATASIRSSVFYRLPRGMQSDLLAMMVSRKVRRNSVVMLQGTPATAMYVIRRGKVQISRREGPGKEKVISILGEGDAFGERAVLAGKPYSQTALALTECQISELSTEQLNIFVARHPKLKRMIEAYISSGDETRSSFARNPEIGARRR